MGRCDPLETDIPSTIRVFPNTVWNPTSYYHLHRKPQLPMSGKYIVHIITASSLTGLFVTLSHCPSPNVQRDVHCDCEHYALRYLGRSFILTVLFSRMEFIFGCSKIKNLTSQMGSS